MRVLALGLTLVSSVAVAAEPVTLERCAALAVAAGSGAADAQVLEARAVRLEAESRGPVPLFTAGAEWSPPSMGPANGDWLAPGTLRGTIGVDVPFDLARDEAPMLRAERSVEAAVSSAQRVRSDLAAAGIEACLRLHGAQRAVRMTSQRAELERAALEAGELRLASAMMLPAEAAALRARHASAQASATAARAELMAAEGLARVVLGLPTGSIDLRIPEALEAPALLAGYAERARGVAFSGVQESALPLPRSGRGHQIDVFARVGVDTPGLSSPAVFGLLGARYTTELGGGSMREARDGLAAAKDRLEMARIEAEGRERAARATAAAAALEAARAAIPARVQEVERARASLALLQARGSLGTVPGRDEQMPHELLAAQSDVIAAAGQLAETRQRALLAAVELWRAAGAGEQLANALGTGNRDAGAIVEAAAVAAPRPSEAFAAIPGKGLWVWQTKTLLDDPAQAQRLWAFCRRWGFGVVYVFVGEPGDPKSPLRRPRDLAALVRAARSTGLDVEALAGDPEWLQASGRTRARDLAKAVAEWQKQHPGEEQFSALHLDVEPHALPQWRNPSSRPALLDASVAILTESARAVRPLPLVADVPDTLEEGAGARVIGAADRVVIMAYRVRPGDAATRAEPLCALAAQQGKRAVVALDTAEGGEPGTTFFGNANGLFAAAQAAAARLATSPACSGPLAVHDDRGIAATLKD